jgi:hypothetical protein
MDLTPRQRAPLLVRGASVALTAGAGCGKTTVLTHRFLGALDDHGRVGAIVARPASSPASLSSKSRSPPRSETRPSPIASAAGWPGGTTIS